MLRATERLRMMTGCEAAWYQVKAKERMRTLCSPFLQPVKSVTLGIVFSVDCEERLCAPGAAVPKLSNLSVRAVRMKKR